MVPKFALIVELPCWPAVIVGVTAHQVTVRVQLPLCESTHMHEATNYRLLPVSMEAVERVTVMLAKMPTPESNIGATVTRIVSRSE